MSMLGNARFLLAFASSGVSVAAALMSPALPAHAAARPAWRIVFTRPAATPANVASFFAVGAPGQRDAWAVGGTGLNGTGAGRPIAYRWNGSRWQAGKLPAGLRAEIDQVSAPSQRDVWAVSDLGGYILHFNGSHWATATKRFTGGGELTGVTAFGPANVWVFGGPGATGGNGTWRFNGRSWTKDVAATQRGIITASALAPRDMWAIGSISAPGDSIFHYTGRWTRAKASAFAHLELHAILALSSSGVWASGSLQTSAFRAFLVHRTAHGWVKIKVPWSVSPLPSLVSDGHGGLWLPAEGLGAGRAFVLHRSASGRWTRFRIANGIILRLGRIPGTRSVWGAGQVRTSAGAKAAIWVHGRA